MAGKILQLTQVAFFYTFSPHLEVVGKGRQSIRILIWYVIAVVSFIPNRNVSMHV